VISDHPRGQGGCLLINPLTPTLRPKVADKGPSSHDGGMYRYMMKYVKAGVRVIYDLKTGGLDFNYVS